jgi:hypothetical protein
MKKTTLFYHGSWQPIPNQTLRARPRRPFFDRQIEQLVNNLRPKGSPDRMQCWFLVKQRHNVDYAGGYEQYVYQVQPITKISQHHFGWISQVLKIFKGKYSQKVYKENRVLIHKLIANYWSGKYYNSSNDAGGSTWEWLTATVKIIKQVE